MKKRYYIVMAIAMTIFSFVYSPIKSYAAGNTLQYARNWNSYLRTYVSYNAATEAVGYIPQDTEINTNQYSNFDATINISLENRVVSSDVGFHYVSGYFKTDITIPFSMNNNASLWAFSYDVEYSDMQQGVSFCIPRCYASSGSNSITFLVYVILDNAMIYDHMAFSLGNATLNLHFETKKPASNYESYLTLDSAQSESYESNVIHYGTNPNPDMGLARVIELAIERAIDFTVTTNIDNIATWIQAIRTMFPDYMDTVIAKLQSIIGNTDTMVRLLLYIYNQDSSFYNLIEEYLESYGMTEASQAASEATEVQEQMSEVAESLEVEQPTIDEAFTIIDEELDLDSQEDLFFYLRGNNNILVTILILVFSLGLCGYVLYGRM